jgi:O-antigen ligase
MPDLKELEAFGYDPHQNRLVGSWLDPNFIGGFFAVIIAWLLSHALFQKKKLALSIIIIFTLAAALFLTYSRSAYLALACALLITGLLKSRKVLLIIIILCTLAVSVSDRAQQRLSEFYTSAVSIFSVSTENPDPTARLRLESWVQSISLISQKPLLGFGYNNLSYAKLENGQIKSEDVHSASGSDSSLLTILAATGVIGFVPFILIYLQILASSFHNFLNKNSHQELKASSLAALSATSALLVHSVFTNSLLFPQIMIFFWPLIAIYLHQQKNSSAAPETLL